VQEEVHRAQAGDRVDDLDAAHRVEAEVLALLAVELVLRGDPVVGGEEEAAGAAGGVDDRLAGLRGDAGDDGVDERARGEVLAGAGLGVLRVPLEEALVGVALDVGADADPLLLVDEVGDQALELGRVLDLVLGLAEDDAEEAVLLAQVLEGGAVVALQVGAVALDEARPVVALGDRRLLLPGRLGLLVGHLEEEQVGELLEVVAVGEAVVAEDVAVGPELVDDAGGVGAHRRAFLAIDGS
jgi:hypothetical protein